MTRVDQIGHVAIVAESIEGDADAGGTTVIVAEARFVVEASGDRAEIALAVADAWQGVGLGTAPLRRLCHQGRLRGLLGFQADVMADNVAMLALLRTQGSRMGRHPHDATLRRLWVPIGAQDFEVQLRKAVVHFGNPPAGLSRPARSFSGASHSAGDF